MTPEMKLIRRIERVTGCAGLREELLALILVYDVESAAFRRGRWVDRYLQKLRGGFQG